MLSAMALAVLSKGRLGALAIYILDYTTGDC